MPSKYFRPYCLCLETLLIWAIGAVGQAAAQRVDTPSGIGSDCPPCSCSSSITASVIITTIVVLILVTLWWCYARHRARKAETKPDPQALSRAAYDNPHFQGDEIDQPDGGQVRINTISTSQPTQVSTSPCPSAKVKTTATNTTSTLERGKTTLERVIHAVIGGGRTGSSSKETKDDSCIGMPSQVSVPLHGHDFTGLGFTVHGNFKEGLFIKEVMSRGPASQSGQVIPGDRVSGFTVLTDHIVFEDAITILSYASVYPVLLHLEKGRPVALSGSTSQSSKGKHSVSAPSLTLMHPSFKKSQSFEDLHQVKILDIEKLKIGTIVPIKPKIKQAPSPGLKHELPKIQHARHVQRSTESRHSERAIDVPGVEVKSKLKMPGGDFKIRAPDIKLDIGDLPDDKTELASVEVHRPMSTNIEMDMPSVDINLPAFNDAKLSEATENVGINAAFENQKPDPKKKFGIKVFPDVAFPMKLNKKIDMDLERGESRSASLDIKGVDLTHENEMNIMKEKSFGIGLNAPEISLKTQKGDKNIDLDQNITLSAEVPNLDIKPLQIENQKSGGGKFGFGFKGFSSDREDVEREGSGYIDLDDSNIVLPSLNIKTDVSKDKITKELESDNEKKNKKSKHGFKIGMPDINLPSFGMKASSNKDKESPEVESSEKCDDDKNSKSKGFKFDLPDISLPSFALNSGKNRKNSLEAVETKEDLTLKLENPDINLPAVDFKAKLETDINLPKLDADIEKIDLSPDVNETDKSGLNFKLKGPNMRLPSLGFQTKGIKDEDITEEANKDDDRKSTKNKHSHKFGLPDISLPSLNLKGISKSSKEADSENEDDLEMRKKRDEEEKERKKKESNFDMNFKMPDISMPTVSMNLDSNQQDKEKLNSDKDSSEKTKTGFSIGMPDFDLKFKGNKKNDGDQDDQEEDNVDKNKSESKFGFKAELPDVNFPSYNLRKKKSKDLDAKVKMTAPDIPTPDVKLDQNFEGDLKLKAPSMDISGLKLETKMINDDEDKEKELGSSSSGLGFTVKGPDVSLPSFGIKSKTDGDHDLKEIEEENKTKKEKKKSKEKSGFNFKFKGPEFSFPNFSNKSDKHSKEDRGELSSPELEIDSKGIEITAKKPELDINAEMPNLNLESATVVEPEKPSKKSKFGLSFKTPDLSMPSLHLKGKKKEGASDSDAHSIDPKISLPSSNIDADIGLSGISTSNIDVELPDLKKTVEAENIKFEVKDQDFSLPSINLTGRRTSSDLTDNIDDTSKLNLNLDGPKISIPKLDMHTDNQYKGRIGADIDGPDFEIPSFKLGTTSSSTKEKQHTPQSEDEDKDNNDKSKFNFKINLPDFSFPKFGSDSKENDKLESESVNVKTSEYSLPEFKMSSNKERQGVEFGSDFNINSPKVEMPDIALSAREVDLSAGYEVHSANKEADEGKAKAKKGGFGFNMNLPEFNLPTLDFGSKDKESKNLETNYSLPDELKAEVNMRGPRDLDIHDVAKDIHFESPDFISKEFTIPSLSSPDLGFEDEKIKSGKADNQELDCKQDYDLSVRLPDLTVPKFGLKGKGSMGYEDEASSKNLSLDSNLPDIDTEFVDDDALDELNITDATKKKRFGFKIKGPEMTMPDFLKRSSNNDERSVKVSMDGNQSDEVKSLNLKLKAPTVSLLEGSSKMDYERPDDESETDGVRVKLPRVQLPAFKSKLYVDDVNLDKSIGDSGYSDQGENKLCEADLPSPKFSSGIKLFGSSSNSKKFNESDEWKIKGGTGVKMPNLNFNINSNDEVPEDDREHLLKYKINERDIGFNADDPDFVIPDFKTFSENIPSLKIESNADPTKKIQESTEYFENGLPNFSLNLHKNPSKDFDETNDNSVFNIRGTSPYYPKYGINSLNTNDINVSLDSSSLEAESDLPEADSDLKKASLEFPLDMSTLSDDFSEEAKFTNKFGNAFGFQGFKKHIKVEGIDTSSNNEDLDVERKVSLNFSELEPPIETINRTIVVGDLPEADFHLDMKGIKQVEGSEHKISSPEIELPVGYSIQDRLNAFEKGFDNKKRTTSESTDSESDKRKSRNRRSNNIEEMEIQERSKEANNENDRKFSIEADEVKGKLKGGKAGIGIGLKGFGRSSDSEDNNESPKIISNDTELGDGQEGKEKSRVKAKKTFSFKAFGRSSSDTDEENSEKVSNKPMVKPEQEEKVKLRNKNSLTFGFKQRSSKNSDSEDNGVNDKVEANPQIEAGNKKQKMKFGFMNKSKPSDVEHSTHTELSGEKKDFDEEGKIKSKSAITVSSRSTKEMKYDIKSESEPGEDEKMSMDSRGEDVRAKSRYGINFGFKRNQGKTSSDSEGGDNEDRVNLNERGSSDKKESKGKSIKVFKGLKNLKGKIQSEINKMRHDSPSSDDDMHLRDDEALNHGEKRKKISKKKDKEKNQKHETEGGGGGGYLDTSEEAAITSAASAAKDTRRMRMDRQSRTSSSSSDSSSSDNEDKSLEVKKKKKYKVKRKEEGRIVTTGLTEVDEALHPREGHGEIDEKVSFSQRTVPIHLSSLEAGESFPVNVASRESSDDTENHYKDEVNMKQSMEIQSSPRRYVVVREMKLKPSPKPATDHGEEIVEMIEKENREIRIPPPVFPREKATFSLHTDTEGTHWGSENDMGNRQLSNGVNISESSGKQRLLTDSEELKRRAASLGDLSRLHEGYGGTGNLLERAVSLDLKNASNCPPALHIRRLQLPDSSATSIDEADEPLSSSSPKKLELSGGLKAASQWGTLEEALRLGINSNEHMEREGSSIEPSSIITTKVVTTSRPNEGHPISNIEISGDRGPSVTALSVSNNCWNDTSFEDENPPSLPSSPIPVARTTITVKEEPTTIMTAPRMKESNVVVVGANERLQNLNNIRNVSVEMNPTHNNQSLQSLETVILSGKDDLGFYSHLSDDIERLQQQQGGGSDSGIVTVTMIPADSYPDTIGQSPPPVPPKPKGNRTLSTPPELITYENIIDTPIVTVNGEITIETSDHNLSDEFITPDSTPQKSMTQITLEGDGGYTVTEGQYSRTVIISNPDTPSPVSIVQTDRDSSLPYLE